MEPGEPALLYLLQGDGGEEANRGQGNWRPIIRPLCPSVFIRRPNEDTVEAAAPMPV